ncbi:MAG: hypothetical protein GX591_17115 [Planctomycetes bacterium]|nr:hypothetical protein [Planctomycetota bacterium]
MFEILNIPPPAMPGGALGMLLGASGLLAGLALALFGCRWAGRLAPAVCLGALAAAAGAAVARRLGLDPTWPAAVTGAVAAVAGLILPAAVWAIGAGLALAAAAELALLHRLAPIDGPAGFDPTGMALGAYATATLRTLGAWLSWMIGRAPLLVLGAGGGTALAGVLLGAVKPRPTRIIGSGLLGAAMVVGGVWLAVASVLGGMPGKGQYRLWIVAVPMALLAAGGIVYQVRADRIARAGARGKKTDDEGGRHSHGDVRRE